MCFGNTQGPTQNQNQNQSSSSVTSTMYDPWVTSAGQNVVGTMQSRAAANAPTAYGGPSQAAFGPQWTAATDYLTGALGQGAPQQLGAASNLLTSFLGGAAPGDISSYMSPYVAATLQPTIQNIELEANKQGAGNAAAATMAGQYGGSAQGVRQALLDRATQQNIANATSSAYNNAFTNAQNARNTAIGQYLGGIGQLGGIGSTIAQYLAGLAGQLGGMGATQQQAGNTGIANALNIIKQNALLPVQQMSPLAAALAEIPKNNIQATQSTGSSTGTSTSSQPDNSGMAMLGSLLAASA